MRTKFYIVVFYAAMASLMPIGLVHGQAPLQPAQPGAAAPKADLYEENLKATERLSKYMNELEKEITDKNKLLKQELKSFAEADKAVDELLSSLKRGIDMGDPNGELVKSIERFVDAAQSGANRAKARQAEGLSQEFLKRKEDFQASKDRILKLYPEYMNMYREIEKRKGDLELAKQLRSLTEASKLVKEAVKKYEDAGPMFKEIFEKFPKPFTGETQ